jgi:hypothetical protein
MLRIPDSLLASCWREVLKRSGLPVLMIGSPLCAQPPGQPGLPAPGIRSVGNGLYEATTQVLVQPGDYARDDWPSCQANSNAELANVARSSSKLLK